MTVFRTVVGLYSGLYLGLYSMYLTISGQRCHVSGWGKDAFTAGAYQHVLKEVELPILGHRQCENMLKRTRLGPGFELHQGFICAGGEEGKYPLL